MGSDSAVIGGHDILALERFMDDTRHMIIFDVLTWKSPVGDKGERLRLFLSDKGYAKAQEAEKRGDIKIRKHAAIIEGHILKKRKKQFNKNKAKSKEGNANFDLGNVIAKLSAKTNSPYNLTNIYNLTVFQLYDQFYQIIQNNQIDGYVLKWAAWGSEEFDFSLWYNNNKTK